MSKSSLGAFAKSMEQLSKFTSEIDGEIAKVSFDPNSPSSIENAIQEVNDAIVSKANDYRNNHLVTNLASQMKENLRSQLLEKAAAARMEKQ